MSTLLERWDRTDHKETINRDEIRRALAIAQAVEDCASVSMEYGEIMRRADELLEEKP